MPDQKEKVVEKEKPVEKVVGFDEDKDDDLNRNASFTSRRSETDVVQRKKLVPIIHYSRANKQSVTQIHEVVCHPFMCRLHDSEGFCVTSMDSLINAGFASIALALFTFFRPTPFFLLSIITESRTESTAQTISKTSLLFFMWFWLALLFTVLVFLGIVLVVSRHIRKRNVLLLHTWGLLLLYLDVFVWVSLTIIIHVATENWREVRPAFLDRMQYPFVFFMFIYFEEICFAFLYYIYATFFIPAELTIIERFFP